MTQAMTEKVKQHSVVDLPIDKIIPTPDNPRKITKNDPAIMELVESVKATGGVLVPVIVRRHPTQEGMYDLRAGACRLMACTIAGFTTIKAEVMELNGHQAREITTIENLKRKDLTPMEEAEGIGRLLAAAADTTDIEHVAATLGWPIGKVYRRMAIANLTPKWRKALAKQPADGDARGAFGRWGIGHMELIARYDQTTQDQLLQELTDEYANHWSVDVLRKWLGQKFLLIKRAQWDPKDETLHPKAGACANCPKRSSHTPHLFDDLDTGKTGDGDRCLDPTCWNEKVALYLDRRSVELKGDNPKLVFVSSENIYGELLKALDKRFPGVRPVWKYEYHNVKKADKGAIPALVVYGDGVGTIRYVKPSREDSGSGRSSKAKGPDGHLTMKAKHERLDGRRAAHAINALKEKLREYDPVQGFNPQGNVDKYSVNVSLRMLVIMTIFGTAGKRDVRDKKTWDAAEAWPVAVGDEFIRSEELRESFFRLVWAELQPVFCQRLLFYDMAGAADAIPEARKIAALTGIDFDALLKAAEEAIPEPKSWTKAEPEKKAKTGKKEKTKKPVKGVCRVCGCTETTPCIHPISGDSCAWADKSQTLCTTCKEKLAAKAGKQKPAAKATKKKKGGK